MPSLSLSVIKSGISILVYIRDCFLESCSSETCWVSEHLTPPEYSSAWAIEPGGRSTYSGELPTVCGQTSLLRPHAVAKRFSQLISSNFFSWCPVVLAGDKYDSYGQINIFTVLICPNHMAVFSNELDHRRRISEPSCCPLLPVPCLR
jgi:hypothetical protein